MALPFCVQGSRRPSLELVWEDADGDVVNLMGATLTGRIEELLTGTARDVDGDLTVTDGAGGVLRWDLGEGDVSEAGEFLVQFSAAFGSEPTPALTKTESWVVKRAV